MHIHIIGICGTFMAGLAVLAKQKGMRVTGCDSAMFPPMSTQLVNNDITVIEGFGAEQINLAADYWIIGNVAPRNLPIVEKLLETKKILISGPQFLAEKFLQERFVIAIAGTHSKTTVSSLVAWILESAERNVGFLIGGIPRNFEVSARIGDLGAPFIIEADEYDTAFFDKRSKFVHYKANIVILNNLEFDHADIFSNLESIEVQFHHWIRTLPASAKIYANSRSKSLKNVLNRGCWSELEFFNNSEGLNYCKQKKFLDGLAVSFEQSTQQLSLKHGEKTVVNIMCPLIGDHNFSNVLASFCVARELKVSNTLFVRAIESFKNVKKRMELRAEISGIKVFDDFAHHPTAIKATVSSARDKYLTEDENKPNREDRDSRRLLAVFEPRSNTLKLGAMQKKLASAFSDADMVFAYVKDIQWDLEAALIDIKEKVMIFECLNKMVDSIISECTSRDVILIMSNGSFGNIHEILIRKLRKKYTD